MDDLRCPRCDSEDVVIKRSGFGAWKVECNFCYRKSFSHLNEEDALKHFLKRTYGDKAWLKGFHMGIKCCQEWLGQYPQKKPGEPG